MSSDNQTAFEQRSAERQMRDLIGSQAAEWFVLHRSGELSESQREHFADWLRASPAHAREYLSLTGLNNDLGIATQRCVVPAATLAANARRSSSVAHAQVAAFPAISASFSRVGKTAAIRPSFNKRVLGLAAAIAAIACLALALFALPQPTSYRTAHAEQRSWRLPDGSTVHLNTNSAIELKFSADARRIELLRGQAIFQVAKDAARPFSVRSGNVDVKALGTQFDVYRKAKNTLVSVIEGRVAVLEATAPSANAREMEFSSRHLIAELNPGEQANVSGNSTSQPQISRKHSDVQKTVAWLQRQVVFDHDSLGDAVDEFNRYNEVQIRVDDPALRREEVSGIFSAYDTDSFIQFLKRQPGMRVEQREDAVLVTSAVIEP